MRSQKILEKDPVPLTADEKRELWGDGPWCDEYDWFEFEHEGFMCYIVRTYTILYHEGKPTDSHNGFLCGYVQIPTDHPLASRELIDTNKFCVHGGITFSESFDDMHYVGFDCAHCLDLIPSHAKYFNCVEVSLYRTYFYVYSQVQSLAHQIANWKPSNETF